MIIHNIFNPQKRKVIIYLLISTEEGDLIVDYYVKPTEMHHITMDTDFIPEEMN
jgi:hypothetical protein